MKVRTFIVKCILAAVPLMLLSGYTLMFPMCYMDEEYPAWRLKKGAASGREYVSQDFDTVIVGDSGAMSALIPELIGDSCINMAAGGATSVEMYFFLSEYLEDHEAPKTAVIMFAPFHYWHIDNYETRTQYFRAVGLSDLCRLQSDAKACGALSVRHDGWLTGELSARLGLPNRYLPAIYASRFVLRREENEKILEDLRAAHGWGSFGTQDGCWDESYETSYEDMTIDGDAKLITLYMQKLLRLCDDNGIRIVLLQPAVNDATFEKLNEHYYGSYRNYIKQLSAVAGDMVYETDLRVYDGRYFSDTSHLNREGAEKFTNEVLSLINGR
ncbi:MAG: hypothetical protein K6G58_10445 [Lachnospiraceae bacterium]|nr:hypothetical protein [Lachnospiraceae bacterium]